MKNKQSNDPTRIAINIFINIEKGTTYPNSPTKIGKLPQNADHETQKETITNLKSLLSKPWLASLYKPQQIVSTTPNES